MGVPWEIDEGEAESDDGGVGTENSPAKADDGARTHLAKSGRVGFAEVAGGAGGGQAIAETSAPGVGDGFKVGIRDPEGQSCRDEGVRVNDFVGKGGKGGVVIGVVAVLEALDEKVVK